MASLGGGTHSILTRRLLHVARRNQQNPEQIELDYQALVAFVPKERLVDLVAKGWLFELIGEEQILDWFGRGRLLERIGEDRAGQWLAERCPPPVLVAAPPAADP